MKTLEKIVLPALRGVMGDWVYYSCLVNMNEISERINFAEEIHKNERLSDMIQRQLKKGRSEQISEYLQTQPERFFNSLVVATYGGQPNWHSLTNLKTKNSKFQDLNEETIESVGFLILRGDERLFAIDGQHRLSGIKQAIKKGMEEPYDDVSIIFVAHNDNKKGLERTRRLFTTLNKTAKPVSKGDIIALDEDDVMSICVRRLIEETNLFKEERVAFVANNNMPIGNLTSITTIGNLYDVLTILFTNVESELKKKKNDLQKIRPKDEILDKYFNLSKKYFSLLQRNFPELDEFFSANNTNDVVTKYRGSHGGNALFRPIGQEIFILVIAQLSQNMSLKKAVELASSLPRNLNDVPYDGLMWDSKKRAMINSYKATLREILIYMVTGKSKFKEPVLLEKYRKYTGNDKLTLPEKVINN